MNAQEKTDREIKIYWKEYNMPYDTVTIKFEKQERHVDCSVSFATLVIYYNDTFQANH